MTTFADLATVQTISLTAMEEASRYGERTADIDHMFLALVIDEHSAGRTLRSLGITLERARGAVATQHEDQLASIGIPSTPAGDGEIEFHKTGGYQWSKRAQAVLSRAERKEQHPGDSAALLRELLAEPSGLIVAVLNRLSVTSEAVTARLAEIERATPDKPGRGSKPDRLTRTSESFVPAPPAQVWDFVADPARIPEWDFSVGDIEGATTEARVGQSWVAASKEQSPDGKAIKVKPQLRSQRVELLASEKDRLIEWRFHYPDAPRANSRRIRIELIAADGGTQMRVTFAWERPGPRPGLWLRPVGVLMRPAVRFALWMQVSQIQAGISRAFR